MLKRALLILLLIASGAQAAIVWHTTTLVVRPLSGGTPTPTATPSATPSPTPPLPPKGNFYLPSSAGLDPTLLALSTIDGVVIGGDWNEIEPTTRGSYDWTHAASGQDIDTQLGYMVAAGKPCKLIIATGGGFISGADPGKKPDWLKNAIDADSYPGEKYMQFVDTLPDGSTATDTIPVFWEPTLLAAHAEMIAAVAAHVYAYPGASALIKVVYVPWVNASTNDYNPGDISNASDGISDDASPPNTTPATRWAHAMVNSGYSTMADALVAAGNSTYAAFHAAFPDKLLSTAIGVFNSATLNPSAIDFFGSVFTHFDTTYGTGWIVLQKNNLNGGNAPHYPGTGSPAWSQLAGFTAYPKAFQEVWHAYSDCAKTGDPLNRNAYGAKRMNAGTNGSCDNSTKMLKQSYDTAVTYGASWVETYATDVQHLGTTNADPDDSSDAIAYGHSLLKP